MTAFRKVMVVTLPLAAVLVALALATAQAQLKPLAEVDVLKLIELQIDDAAIIKRIEKGGLAFKTDEAMLKRFKEAGASEEVLAALQGKKPDATAKAAAERLMVQVKRQYGSWDNPLHSEFQVNGKTVDIFTSDTYKPIDKHLRPGWNTIAIKTTPQRAAASNGLIFRIGPMHKEPNDELVMKPVLWEFRNDTDWKFDKGKYTHPLGPDVTEVTLSYRLYFAGLEREKAAVKKGDYVLEGQPQYGSWNPPVTTTVFVNGTPLNTFLLRPRDIVVTPLLKKGKNEIKLVSSRVLNSLTDNDINVNLSGPAEYSVAQQRFLLKPIVQQKSLVGWERSTKTGQLVNKDNPASDQVERVIPFFLDEAP